MESFLKVLQDLTNAIDKNIAYVDKEHPWIPGANFQDGEIARSLSAAKEWLDNYNQAVAKLKEDGVL